MFDDFFSNIKEQASSTFSNFSDSIVQNGTGYVKSFLGFGEAPKQNLTAQQVQSGQSGAPISGNALPSIAGIPMPYLLIGGAVAAAFLLKK